MRKKQELNIAWKRMRCVKQINCARVFILFKKLYFVRILHADCLLQYTAYFVRHEFYFMYKNNSY